jgi:transcriptional regulator with XRE-family HTH domain
VTPDPNELAEDERSLARYDDELTTLAHLLSGTRRDLGMSIAVVAMNTGMSSAGLSRIERGERTPTVRTLLALTEMYGMKIEIDSGEVRVEAP